MRKTTKIWDKISYNVDYWINNLFILFAYVAGAFYILYRVFVVLVFRFDDK